MRYIKPHHIAVLDFIILLTMFVIALALDSGFGVSLFWQFYAIAILFAAMVTIPKFLLFKSKSSLWLFAAFTASLCALHFVVISPEKSLLLLQRDITDGMTLNEVETAFNQRFPEQGRFRRPTREISDGSSWNPYGDKPQLKVVPDQKITYQVDVRDGDICRLIVGLKDGRAVGNQYIPD